MRRLTNKLLCLRAFCEARAISRKLARWRGGSSDSESHQTRMRPATEARFVDHIKREGLSICDRPSEYDKLFSCANEDEADVSATETSRKAGVAIEPVPVVVSDLEHTETSI